MSRADRLSGRLQTTIDVVAVAVAIFAACIAFSAAARGPVTVGPATLTAWTTPALHGSTVVELPPFGSVSAATHTGPVRFSVRLDEIDVSSTTKMLENGDLSQLETLTAGGNDLPLDRFASVLWRYVGLGLLAAAAAAAVVCLVFRRSAVVIAVAVALAVLVPASAVGVSAKSWHASAFAEPTLRGGLTYAPKLIDMFSTRVSKIERLREQASKVASDLASYYADHRSLMSGGSLEGTYRVLHVTDLHLDPVGAQLAKSIERSYETSLVIDTGDLPILGTPVESRVFESLIGTATRVYIPGNHDSPASIAALESLGVSVLSSGTINVDGLTIMGVADPVSRGFGVEPDPAPITAAASAAYRDLAARLASGETTPDVLALHNPIMQTRFVGKVPLILTGHTHAATYRVVRGTVGVNSGTLGGTPYDPTISGRTSRPYTASVLYFTAEEPRRLIAVDRIAVYSNGSTTVSREVVDTNLLP